MLTVGQHHSQLALGLGIQLSMCMKINKIKQNSTLPAQRWRTDAYSPSLLAEGHCFMAQTRRFACEAIDNLHKPTLMALSCHSLFT